MFRPVRFSGVILLIFFLAPFQSAEAQKVTLPDNERVVSEVYTLFYFDDPVRLLQSLSQNSGQEVEELRRSPFDLAQSTKQLLDKEIELNDATVTFRKARNTLATLKRKEAEAKAKNETTNKPLKEAKEELKKRKDETAKAQDEVDIAKANVAQLEALSKVSPDQEALKTQLADAKKDLAKKEHALALAKIEEQKADRKVKELEAELEGKTVVAPTDEELKKAQTDFESARDKMRASELEVRGAALTDALSFGAAIDRGALWWAAPVADSSDDFRKVLIFAFPDSRMLYFRGPEKNVEELIATVQAFDRPEPQARLTLWTLEISSDATEDGAKETNKSLDVIQQQVRTTTEDIETLTLYFQLLVRKKVDECARKHNKSGPIGFDDRVRGYYAPDVLEILRYEEICNKWFVKHLIPDPANINSLAEALVVHTLSSEATQAAVQGDLRKRIEEGDLFEYRPSDPTNLVHSAPAEESPDSEEGSAFKFFPFDALYTPKDKVAGRRWHIAPECDRTGIFGREIAVALKSLGTQRLLWWTSSYFKERDKARRLVLEKEIAAADARAKVKSLKRKAQAKTETDDDKRKALEAEAEAILLSGEAEQLRLAAQLEKRGVVDDPRFEPVHEELLSRLYGEDKKEEDLVKMSEGKLPSLLTESFTENTLRAYRAGSTMVSTKSNSALSREAVVNETLKDLLRIIDDRVQGAFIDPMYVRIRDDLNDRCGVQVGVVQRTSVLARNRLIARVVPKASASVPLGQEQDVLKAAIQLGQILDTAGTANLIAALAEQRKRDSEDEKPQEIYGLSVGNRFQVTPIVDASGQALRFRFDHVTDTHIQDPDKTSNPKLNRIERHTVNTEVQLSNFELREISRFQANSRLGLPEKKYGGIPILKDIPGLNEIPLIGWFSRQWGEAAVTQQSLIFGHTTIFPTIESIHGLLASDMPLPPRAEYLARNVRRESQNKPAATPAKVRKSTTKRD